MSSDTSDVKKIAEQWARDFAGAADVEYVPLVQVDTDGELTTLSYFFDRMSEFSACKVAMRLIRHGNNVELRVHADNWIVLEVNLPTSTFALAQAAEYEGNEA